jgi:hypothetical protein
MFGKRRRRLQSRRDAFRFERAEGVGVNAVRNHFDGGEVEGSIFRPPRAHGVLNLRAPELGVGHAAADARQRLDRFGVERPAVHGAVEDDRGRVLHLPQFVQVGVLNPDVVDDEDEPRLQLFDERDDAFGAPAVAADLGRVDLPIQAVRVAAVVGAELMNLVRGGERLENALRHAREARRHRGVACDEDAWALGVLTHASEPPAVAGGYVLLIEPLTRLPAPPATAGGSDLNDASSGRRRACLRA